MRRWGLTALAALGVLALAGCGLSVRSGTPSAGSGAGDRTSAARAASERTSTVPGVRNHELATPPGPAERAPVASSAPEALARFARTYINWNAADVRSRLSRLAADCVGQARTAIQLEAAQTGADPELRQAGIANHGSVEAITSLAGSTRRYVVVTRERTTATDSSAYQGLAAAWHLTVATMARRGGGWVISGWQPES
jgi:hypothetical protein